MRKIWGVLALALFCGTVTAAPVIADEILSVPFHASPEEEFVVDPETGLLMEYTGKNVDVVIPDTIEGVTITGIHHNAFDSCRDYTDTDVAANRTSWVPLRSVVIPETVEFLEDSCFSYCQQLEIVVCYAPLESTGKNTFEECRSLENVYFVNGVSAIDSCCFYNTESLKTVTYGTDLESIASGAFTHSGIESFVVDAKDIAVTAFWNCENLSQLHFTSKAESIENGAVSSCRNIELLCFETMDLSWLDSMGVMADAPEAFTVQVPLDYPEENLEYVNRVAGATAYNSEVTILQEDCSREMQTEDPTMIYLETISQPSAYEAESPEPETSTGEEKNPVGEEGEKYLGSWYGVSYYMGDEIYSVSDFGSEIMLSLDADGTAVLLMDGDEMQMTWEIQGEKASVSGEDMEDTEIYISEDGELYFESYGMGYIFQKDEAEAISEPELTSTPEATPSPTPEPTPSSTPEPTPSPTPEPTPSPTPSPTPEPTPSPTPEPTSSPTPEPTPSPTPSPTPIPSPTPVPVMSYEERMGVTFPCIGAKNAGVMLDATALGADYSVTFYENGTVDLILADIASQEKWTQRIVEVDANGSITNAEGVENTENQSDLELFEEGRRKAFVIDYSGMELIAVWTENGFEMNYFDTMTLYFERR